MGCSAVACAIRAVALGVFCSLFVGTFAFAHGTHNIPVFTVDVKTIQLDAFEPSKPNRKKFGPLTFRSGVVLEANKDRFGGFSGLAMMEEGSRLVAISDSGYWLTAEVERDAAGKIAAIKKPAMAQIYSGDGPRDTKQKYFRDAEGLTVFLNEVFVSFEANNVLSRYERTPTGLNLEPLVLDLPNAILKADANKGMEALAHGPPGTPLAGHLVTIMERGPRRDAPTNGFILRPAKEIKGKPGHAYGRGKTGAFKLLKDRLYDVTEAEFLPNGDLLILERKFTIASGVGMRLRRIKAASLKAGAEIYGDVVFEAGLSMHIDNMEGMSIYKNAKGETILALISDDNHSLLQRTILLEFVLDLDEL